MDMGGFPTALPQGCLAYFAKDDNTGARAYGASALWLNASASLSINLPARVGQTLEMTAALNLYSSAGIPWSMGTCFGLNGVNMADQSKYRTFQVINENEPFAVQAFYQLTSADIVNGAVTVALMFLNDNSHGSGTVSNGGGNITTMSVKNWGPFQ